VNSTLRYSLLAVFGILAIAMTWNMALRSQEELLWGYRTQVLFLALFFFFLLLVQPVWLKKGKPWRWLSLSGLSMLLLSIGFPDILFPFPFLLFLGFIPLLIIEKEISESEGLRRGYAFWKYAWVTFLGWNIITTFWVSNTAISAGVFAMVANSLLMTIPMILFHHTKRRIPQLGLTAFIAYWISWEFFHLNWELTWPWLTLGNGFAEWPALVQWYEYTGVFGGTLWLLLGNVLGFRIYQKRVRKKPIRGWIIRTGVLLLLPVLASLYLFYSYEEKGRAVEVIVVQPNYEPHYVKFTVPNPVQMDQMIRLTDSLIRPETRYVVFPEAVIHNYEIDRPRNHAAIRKLEQHYRDYPGLNILLGISAYEILANGDQTSRNKRVYISRTGDTVSYESSNIAAQLTLGEEAIPVYKKSKLVPGVEIFPFQDVLWMFKPIVDQVGGTTAGLASQTDRTAFASQSGRVGTLICYESVFGEFVTGFVRNGAEALFVMTNDGWWDDTPGHRQHMRYASLRAIETRRAIGRAANTGISAFLDQRGIIREKIPYNQTGADRSTMLFNDQITFYVRWGNIIARISAFLAGLLFLNLVVRILSGRSIKS